MKPLNIETIRRVTGCRPATTIPKEISIQAVNTDSRKRVASSLFIAIRGESFDGHDFVAEAAAGGAIAALVERPIDNLPGDFCVLQVDSTRAALGRLGRHVREQLRATVIAVAGSNGKTSTKYLTHAALTGRWRGSMAPKSFNNDIGVPLTIFDADPQQDYLVLEMGTNHPGEIRTLTNIGRPDIAVITNCGEEHLEFLGDVAGVRRENASILEGLGQRGTVIVNGDDRDLIEVVSKHPARRITFGLNTSNDLFATDIRCGDDGVRFMLNGSRSEFFVPLLGRHTACNALAAIAVARRMGLAEEEIRQNLAVARGPDMRLQLRDLGGVRILNDAYNANPASMRAALETLATIPAEGRRIAVLGDMRELGNTSEGYHRQLGAAAASAGIDVLACVGQHAKLLALSAAEHGMAQSKLHCFVDSTAAGKVVPRWLRSGDLVLLKASRGVRLEVVAREIEAAMSNGVNATE